MCHWCDLTYWIKTTKAWHTPNLQQSCNKMLQQLQVWCVMVVAELSYINTCNTQHLHIATHVLRLLQSWCMIVLQQPFHITLETVATFCCRTVARWVYARLKAHDMSTWRSKLLSASFVHKCQIPSFSMHHFCLKGSHFIHYDIRDSLLPGLSYPL